MMRCAFIVAIIITALAGCTLIPEYRRPDAPVPASWPTGPAYKETGSDLKDKPVGDINWRAFYTDEKLIKIIEMALQNNRDPRAVALNIEKMMAL